MKATEKKEKIKDELNEEENIGKIRDILFGVQVRDFEKRFSELERHFEKEFAKSRKETAKDLARIEELLEKHVGSLTESIYNEQDSRNSAVKGLSDDLKSAAKNLSNEIYSLSSQTAKNETELRQNLVEQSESIVGLIQANQKEIVSSLEMKSDELQDSKADRKSLAKAFETIANLLSDNKKSSD
jgi:hypothetical protein